MNGASGEECGWGDNAMVKKRVKDMTLASGKDDAIIPHRRKNNDVRMRGHCHDVIA